MKVVEETEDLLSGSFGIPVSVTQNLSRDYITVTVVDPTTWATTRIPVHNNP